jgi:hypothetical protein
VPNRKKNEASPYAVNSYLLAKLHDGDEDQTVKNEVLDGSFEHTICLYYLQSIKFPTNRYKDLTVDEYGLFTFSLLNTGYELGIINKPISLIDIIEKPAKIVDIYVKHVREILIVNDFKKKRYGGIALGVFEIGHRDIIGSISLLRDDRLANPLVVGKSNDFFKTLVRGGFISEWEPNSDIGVLADN